jgi:hypothetical protein
MTDKTETPAKAPTHLCFDGMTWPNPEDPLTVEWTLRYGAPSRKQLHVAASMIAAYKQLAWIDSQRERNRKISALRYAIGADQ